MLCFTVLNMNRVNAIKNMSEEIAPTFPFIEFASGVNTSIPKSQIVIAVKKFINTVGLCTRNRLTCFFHSIWFSEVKIKTHFTLYFLKKKGNNDFYLLIFSSSSAIFEVYLPTSDAMALLLRHNAKTAHITIKINSTAGIAGWIFPK